MTTIAALLGAAEAADTETWNLTWHVRKQIRAKGFSEDEVLLAAAEPQHTSPNGRFPHQRRHVRNGVVAVVDPSQRNIVTVYKDQVPTPCRPDQTDTDARRFARANLSRIHTVASACRFSA